MKLNLHGRYCLARGWEIEQAYRRYGIFVQELLGDRLAFDGADRKLEWVPNLRWFLPHRFAIGLDRLSQSKLEPALSNQYLQFAIPLRAATARDVHYYLEPREVSFWEDRDAEGSPHDEQEVVDEERPARLVGYHKVGALNGIVIWWTHQPGSASIPERRVAMASKVVHRTTGIIVFCGWFFIALSVFLSWVALTATELGAVSQREHGYGALTMLAIAAPVLVLTFFYRASWRRYWRELRSQTGISD